MLRNSTSLCQSYLAATYSYRKIAKAVALTSGPVHSSGLTIVEIINQAANYWKHHDEEWSLHQTRGERSVHARRSLRCWSLTLTIPSRRFSAQ
jgi:hypothetical protein